jgi:hypothetical protein
MGLSLTMLVQNIIKQGGKNATLPSVKLCFSTLYISDVEMPLRVPRKAIE